MTAGTLIAGFVVSTIGFSLFLYGKKQARVAQLVTGLLLMFLPFFVTDPIGLWCVGALMLIGMRGVIEYESRA